MENNLLIKNSVRLLEFKMTDILCQEIGSITYEWTQSPVRVLRGKTSTFSLEEWIAVDNPIPWTGTVRYTGNSIIIELYKKSSTAHCVEEVKKRIVY